MGQILAANLFFTSSLISAIGVYLWSRPPRSRLAAGFAAGLMLVVLSPVPGEWHKQAMIALGCVACGLLGAAACSSWTLLRDMATGPLLAAGTVLPLAVCTRLTPRTLDYFLYVFDGTLGFQPGFKMAALLYAFPWLRVTAELVYFNLPLLMSALYFRERSRSEQSAAALFRYYLALGACGYAFYFFFPAIGSSGIFKQSFPYAPPPVAAVPLASVTAGPVARNCMPSLHTAWVLAMWWMPTGLHKRWRTVLGILLGLTLVYTLGCGAHYFVDMVVAFPFAVAVLAALEKRWQIAVGCGAATLAWLAALRFGTQVFVAAPVLSYMAIAATVGCSCFARRCLTRPGKETYEWPLRTLPARQAAYDPIRTG